MLLGCEPGWQPWSRAISDPQTLSELDQPSRAHVGPPVSAFGQGAEPGWLKPVQTRIRQLSELRYDWDHQGGARINREVLFFAWHVIRETFENDTPPPAIVPLSYGGVQIEWHEKAIDLEIEIEAPFRVHVWYRDSERGSEFEDDLQQDFGKLDDPLRRLSKQ